MDDSRCAEARSEDLFNTKRLPSPLEASLGKVQLTGLGWPRPWDLNGPLNLPTNVSKSFSPLATAFAEDRSSNLTPDERPSLGEALVLKVAQSADDGLGTHGPSASSEHLSHRYGGVRSPGAPPPGGLSPWQLRLARNALETHLDGSISLRDLAGECGLSLSHFSRAFTRSTGVAPHRWLMQRRIDVAKNLIRCGDLPLAEVALASGFADQSHMTRAFARATGQTPGRWRASQGS